MRTPAPSVVNGINDYADGSKPDFKKALAEHQAYVKLLKGLGVSVTALDPLNDYPDSCFVEDPAVVFDDFAVITNPARQSRNHERELIKPAIRQFYSDKQIFEIKSPGTMEGGDVMPVDNNVIYIGHSARTNQSGIDQFTAIAKQFGKTVKAVPVKQVLHLNTGTTYMGHNKLLVAGEYIDNPDFQNFDQINVPSDEAYAVN